MVRTFCNLLSIAFLGLLPAAAHAQAPAAPTPSTPDTEVFAGVQTGWHRESLAVAEFEDTPAQVPERNAAAADAGATFSWTHAAVTFEAGVRGGDATAWSAAAHFGIVSLQLTEEVEAGAALWGGGGPRRVAATGGNDGITGGLRLALRRRFGETGWWTSGGYRLDLGYAALDNAGLFGGTPIDGTAQWLRHDAALRIGVRAGDGFDLYAGARLVWTTLSTDWELAFDVPGVSRDTQADFTTRWPARWLVGVAWANTHSPLVAALELTAGRWPDDIGVTLSVGVRF